MRTRTNPDGSVWTRDGRLLVHYPQIPEKQETPIGELVNNAWMVMDSGNCYVQFADTGKRLKYGDILSWEPFYSERSSIVIVSVEDKFAGVRYHFQTVGNKMSIVRNVEARMQPGEIWYLVGNNSAEFGDWKLTKLHYFDLI